MLPICGAGIAWVGKKHGGIPADFCRKYPFTRWGKRDTMKAIKIK